MSGSNREKRQVEYASSSSSSFSFFGRDARQGRCRRFKGVRMQGGDNLVLNRFRLAGRRCRWGNEERSGGDGIKAFIEICGRCTDLSGLISLTHELFVKLKSSPERILGWSTDLGLAYLLKCPALLPLFPFFTTMMPSPVSPTFTNFSAPSPYSEPSPISDPNYDSPVDQDYPVYPPLYDGNMMTWSPDNKKHHHRTLRNPYTTYDLAMLYIPPRHPPVIHSPVPSHPIQHHQHHHHQQQPMHQQLPPNDALFDVDLEDWTSPPVNSLHAQFPSTHTHTHTHSISLALPQYPPPAAPRVKREELVPAFTGYHHPSSAHYDLSGVPIQNNHDPYVHHQQQVSPTTTNGTYYSPPFQQHHHHHQQIHHHPQQQQQNYVVPAELSPTSPVSSSSPLSPRYADLSHTNAVVCDPRFVSGSHEDMLLKGMLLGGDDGSESWHGERRCSLTSLESEAEEGERDAEGEMGDADADGEDDWEHQHQQQPAVYDQQPQREDPGEEEAPEDEESEEEKEDDYYEDDEESVDDDDNDGEFVLRTRRRRANTSSSAVYPSSYPYVTEGRNLRSRASSRYNPYPSYAGSSASDNGAASYSEDNPNASRRRPSTSSPPLSSSSSSFPTRTLTSKTPSRTRSSSATTTATSTLPVPVPNLTKKSRGRRVPTVSSLEDLRSAASGAGRKRQQQQQGPGKGARMYLCDVEGCGKCFARGEHLKRHVRSIHTYEKPHTCPYPGCGKDFSRHDNLGQHMRVHKDYVPTKGGA
ncbi:uncharacterized protein LACBIDRAFT_301563 [Laccaria bicolor S238N-H82]|uniref:Predicted protein n=1 Tax=Laccaria bicolor (strain S238N-H82 / ATCC MYA-4686) TaxID=486041 RepID=B0CNU1_LACBS|nr:uncharacterized protein LACBIDRAFT_301563 [Laccaria bicolor S238N-H82]EDR15353.1 predicted protein [Laccaria bicolor S238N-H82]|eukprot:XP_001873561.1 predicted protein [Laccaria bicolor S238N-H82]